MPFVSKLKLHQLKPKLGQEAGELVDRLAGRAEDEDALCAVCGGGDWVPHNQIVFCERCDVAVHQRCYGVAEIPVGGRRAQSVI